MRQLEDCDDHLNNFRNRLKWTRENEAMTVIFQAEVLGSKFCELPQNRHKNFQDVARIYLKVAVPNKRRQAPTLTYFFVQPSNTKQGLKDHFASFSSGDLKTDRSRSLW